MLMFRWCNTWRVIELKCWNVETFWNDVRAVMALEEVFTKRKETGELYYFGNDIRSSWTGRLFLFYVQKKHHTSTKRVIRKWRFVVTYDDNLNVFVLVADVFGKPVKCCMCRSTSTRRGFFQDELSRRPRSSNDVVVPSNCWVHVDDGFTENGFRTSQVVDGKYETNSYDRAEAQDDVVDADKCFGNKRSRPALPCRAEHRLIQSLTGVIETTGRCSEKRVPVSEDAQIRLCCKCGHHVHDAKGWEREKAERAVTLFTVRKGDPVVTLADYKCSKRSEWNMYSGEFHGTVTARKQTAFTLDLMYYWVLTSCLLSTSYRTSFALRRLMNATEGVCSRFTIGDCSNSTEDTVRIGE